MYMIDIPILEQNINVKGRYMITLDSDRNIKCIKQIIDHLKMYSHIMQNVFPAYKVFRHAILISMSNGKFNINMITVLLNVFVFLAQEQKLHFDFKFDKSSTKKLDGNVIPFSLLLPV